jgi:hypothetical protein
LPKTAIAAEEIPAPLSDIFSPVFGFEFFEMDSETGRVREFDETFGPLLKQRFFERVYDLAYDSCQLLRTFQQVRARGAAAPEPDLNRQWVYLATTTSDVQDERDRIRRELLERGHRVPGKVHDCRSPFGPSRGEWWKGSRSGATWACWRDKLGGLGKFNSRSYCFIQA